MVQPCGLGTGVLATGVPMGLEPPPGTGSSPADFTASHNGVCSGPSTAQRANSCAPNLLRHSAYLRVCSTRYGHLLEIWPLHRSRFSTPTRWDAALSSRA